MYFRRATMLLAVVVPLALLSACATSPAPSSSRPPSTPDASPSPTGPPLPADAVLTLTGSVTADNGAELALTMVVHSSKAATDPASASGMSAITGWCDGEMTADQLQQGYGLLQADYTATLVGTTAWPANLPLALYPTSQDVDMASSGDVHQIEVLEHPRQPGDYVPHCKQSAFLSGPGTGSIFVALAGDATVNPPLIDWANYSYGFGILSTPGFVGTTPFGGISASRVSFSGCTATVTALGTSLNGPSPTQQEDFSASHCTPGGLKP